MRTKKILFYCLAALMGGCVPIMSLRPLFTSEDLVFDEKLLGTWVQDVNDPNDAWRFTRLDEASTGRLADRIEGEIDKAYRLDITDDGAHKGSLVACLVKLGDRRFLDIFADKLPSGETDAEKAKLPFNTFFFLPTHTFIKVDAIGDELKLRLTDDEKFQELLEAHPDAVKHEMNDDLPVLTASTKELQAFVTKYADDERLFTNEVLLRRKAQ